MANLKVKDADAADKYLAASGTGTDIDPHIVEKEVVQATPDDLNSNTNIQIGDADVAGGNPVPVDATGQGDVPVTLDGETVDVSDRIGRLAGRMTNYDVLADGTIVALNGTVELTCAGMGTVGLGISGTWVGTLVAEIEVGDSVWDPIPLIENTLAEAVLNTTANGNWLLGVAGALTLRIRASLWTSGTATIYLNASAATAGVFLARSIPTGLNPIGTVGIDDIADVVGQATKANSLPVTLSSDEDALAVTDGGSTLSVDDAGGTLTVDGTVNVGAVGSALPAGTNNIGDVDIASALPAGTNTIGKVGLDPQTSGGLSIHRSIDLDESEEEVKGSAGQVFGWFLYNLASAKVYIKFYNATAASVTVGTTTPVLTIPLEADQGAVVEFTNGIEFDTAICVAATTGLADNDTGAPGAGEVVANVFYK